MAGGSQIILHPRDDTDKNYQNNTRNIGLQSVVYHELTSANNVLKSVDDAKALINTYSATLLDLADKLDEYTQVCNRIWALLQNAYQARNKGAKFNELAVKISELAK